MTWLTIGDTECYYIGEWGVHYESIHSLHEGLNKGIYLLIK